MAYGAAESGRRGAIVQAAVVTAAMCLFALAGRRGPVSLAVSACALLAVGVTVHRAIVRHERPGELFGFAGRWRRVVAWSVLGMLVGLGWGVAFRRSERLALLPGSLAFFAIPAAAIGAAEELLYRGFVQGRLVGLGATAACCLAAAAHTAYKCALFLPRTELPPVDYPFLLTATFLGGLLLGALRVRSGNILPPLLAHALFDLIVYGDHVTPPMWVWS